MNHPRDDNLRTSNDHGHGTDCTPSEYLSKLDDDYHASSLTLEKTVLTMAASAFAVTIAFIGNILDGRPPTHAWLMSVAWGLLASTVVLTLVVLQLGVVAMEKLQRELRKLQDDGTFFERADEKCLRLRENRGIVVYRWLAIAMLSLAIIGIAVFSIINLQDHSSVEGPQAVKTQDTAATADEGEVRHAAPSSTAGTPAASSTAAIQGELI